MKKQPGIGKRLIEVQSAYQELWKQFTDAAESQQLITKASNDTYGALLKSGATTTAEALFVLPGWPYKVKSEKGKVVDIAVQVKELMDLSNNCVTKCTTQVGYFKGRDEGQDPLLEMHYDFDTPVSEAHPIFHAQVGKTKWPPEISKLGLTVGQRPDDSSSMVYGKSRIPTAFVGFPQILTVLAADHLPHKEYRQVMAAVRAVHDSLPKVQCNQFGNEVEAGTFPAAHHWYEHRYEALVTQTRNKGQWKATVPLLDAEESGPSQTAAEDKLLLTLGMRRDKVRFVLTHTSK